MSLRLLRTLVPFGACLALLCWAGSAGAQANGYGKLTGVVVDLAGTQQMGVSIWLSPEAATGRTAAQLVTNQSGIFESPRLLPGLYSVRATRAGFLPTIQQHVRITANLTTLVRIELDSVFASLDQLRRQPAQPSESDDWKWVLRTSAASRPVLQLLDGTIVVANDDPPRVPDVPSPEVRTRVEMSNGSVKPGSPSALPGTLGTSVSYDQPMGPVGQFLVAGQMGYVPAAGSDSTALNGGLATIWLPSGEWANGSQNLVVLRQGQSTPTPGGQIVRAMRIEHAGQISFSDHLALAYAAELAMGGVSQMTYKVRPRAQLAWQISPLWSAAVSLQTDPESKTLGSDDKPLQSTIDALGTTPVLIWRKGEISSLAGGWHEEVSIRRVLGARGSLEAAGFHDFSGHQAVFGVGPSLGSSPNSALPFAYANDAGSGGSWGTRLVLKEKIANHLEVAAIYTWAGALEAMADAPGSNPNPGVINVLQMHYRSWEGIFSPIAGAPGSELQDLVRMQQRHSITGRISGKIPRTGTQFAASYKWLDGEIVSRQDLFGEAALGVDPYLSFTVRQRLPSFHTGAHWEAMADFRNILSQGYVPLATQEGQFLLMPVERSFQGGVSFQF